MHEVGPEDVMNLGWALLSLKRRYPGGHDCVVEFACGERRFELVLGPQRLEVAERPSERAAVRVEGSQDAYFDILFRGIAPEALERRGALRVTGDRRVFKEAIAALSSPSPPPAPAQTPAKGERTGRGRTSRSAARSLRRRR